jgi:NADPH:quinone reductase-like Zn-dependent oxidoreductase
MVEELWSAIRDGDITLPVRQRYRLSDIQHALIDAATRGRTGKVLIVE